MMTVVSRLLSCSIRNTSRKFTNCSKSLRLFNRWSKGKATDASALAKVPAAPKRKIVSSIIFQGLFVIGFSEISKIMLLLSDIHERSTGYLKELVQSSSFAKTEISYLGLILILCNCVLFVFSHSLSRETLMKMASSPKSWPVSPLTSMFLHGSVAHLVMNMLGIAVLCGTFRNGVEFAPGSLNRTSSFYCLHMLLECGCYVSLMTSVRYAIFNKAGASVGFSAALCAFLMYQLLQKPNQRFDIIPLRLLYPHQDLSVTTETLSKLIIGFEVLMWVFQKYHRLDSTGHLLGYAMGYLYSYNQSSDEWEDLVKEIR